MAFEFDPSTATPIDAEPQGPSKTFDPSTAREQDGAFKRGWNKATNAMAVSANMAIGDNQAAAERLKVASDYNAANPGSQESQELMQAWEAGDGVSGAFSEVGGEFAKDWREASGLGATLKSAANNVAAVGETLAEQTGNMVAPLAGMGVGHAAGRAVGTPIGAGIGAVVGAPAGGVGAVPGAGAGGAIGGTVGGIGGSILGGAIGNAAQESGYMALGDIQEAGIDPGDVDAVRAYLDENSGRLLEQGATKGAIIATVDRLTMGVASKLLNGPLREATNRALANMGVDAADKAAVKAATQSDAFAAHLAGDAAYQSSKQGAEQIARNMAAFAVDPAGEFTGEFVGTGVATGEWDAKDATLEAVMGLGQSGVMYAGQKAYQAATGRGAKPMVQPQPTAENPAPAPVPAPDPGAGPLSAAANLLPAPEDTGTLYGDEAGNVSGNRPSWVNPENDPSRQSYGPGMDRQASGPIDIEGEVVARGPLQQAAGPTQAALPDLRQGAMIDDSEGNAKPGKLPNTPPRSYVQGGRGMDRQAPIGQRFSNQLAAKNAISKAPEPAALEVVEVGPKQFEVQVKAPVLQNRDRSTPASITQMRSIAASPDYSRLGFSRDFANGAPVVEPGANVLPQALGRQDVATTGSGRKIPVQYAVVEAASLMPSHDVNGSPDEQYATGAKGKSRAIAGNGRVAGLRHAFTQGTAGQYVEQMTGDASLHGISPAVIRGMKEPVLVRIMPREEITRDIGDESNTTGVSALSGAEQAMNDARRISIDDMEFSESGEISETTVRQFVQSMPAAERNNLLDGSRPSRQAYDRAESAIFANAYESEALIRLQAQATDPEVRTVLSGLLVAAPKMARLKGAGAWDIRGLVVEAAEAAVNARRNGQTLEQYAQQIDLDRNPEAQFFIELFAANIRSAKRIGEELSRVVDLFYTEASKPETDMWGAVPRRSRQELLNGATNADTTSQSGSAQAAGNQARPGAAAPGREGGETERVEPAGDRPNPQPAEDFQLNAYSEEELATQAAAQAEAAAQAAADAKAEADKALADKDRNDFTLTGSDRPSDVAAARGQNDMFAPPTRGEKKAEQEQAANNAPETESPASTSERQPISFFSGQPASEYLADGSTIEDGQGQQYRVHYQRNDLVVAHPIIDGKAQVNAGSTVRFHVGSPDSADGRRTDPIYLVEGGSQPAPKKPRGAQAKKSEAEAKARADYFTPGNVVKSYGGNDRVISYSPPDEQGRWSVTVRAVEKDGDTWKDKPNERERTHSTPPDARELKAGPVGKVEASAPAAPQNPAESEGRKNVTESVRYADWVREIARQFQGTYKGRSLAPLASEIAEHAITQNRRLTDEEIAALSESHEVPVEVVEQLVGQPFSFDGIKGAAERGDAGAKALRAQSLAARNVQDAGEKLGGARKDQLRTVRDRLDDMGDEEIASSSLSQLWPKGELDKISDPFEAALYHVVRGLIPAKPRVSYRVKAWVGKVKAARDILTTLGGIGANATAEKMRAYSPGLGTVADQIEVLMALDRKHWGRIDGVRRATGRYSQDGEMVPGSWVSLNIDGRQANFYGHESVASAIPAIKDRVEGKDAPEKRMKFAIYTDRQTSDVFVVKEGDAEMRRLKTFKSVKEARAFLNDEYEAAVALWDAVKNRDNVTKSDMRRSTNDPRVGQNHRDGKDVTPDQFLEAFGFRGVEFGNWVKQGAGGRDRQGMLNDAYDAFMDLAMILNIPPKALSLEGKLGIGFGSRGSGKASAHYEPDLVVINLTKTKGAGTLAHEWFHALDNYFARRRAEQPGSGIAMTDRETAYITYRPERLWVNKKYPSQQMTRSELSRYQTNHPGAPLYQEGNWEPDAKHPNGVRPQVEKAFAELVATLNASPMLQRAKVIDGKTSDGYWSRIIERGARSFETYVIARLADRGFRNDYLANVQTLEQFSRDPGRYPYLTPDEQGPVNEAFDKLFATLETKETDQGVALFSRASGPIDPAGLSESSVVTGKAPENPISLEEAISAAEQFLADYNGNIELSYRIRKKQDELYGPGSIAKIGVIKGAYHPGRGLFTLASDHLSSAADAHETLRHEILGHYGLDTFSPQDKQALLDKILASKEEPSLKPIWDDIAVVYADKSENIQAEEVFARLAEGERSGKEKLADLIGSLLTRLLRKVLGYKKGVITRRELLREIEVISKGIRNGSRQRQTFESETKQRRGAQTETPAFKRWFGDSKVVDADGKPLVVYHATTGDFAVFDRSAESIFDYGDQSDSGGFFFADTAEAVGYYTEGGRGIERGANIVPAFLSIQNPAIISDGMWVRDQAKALHDAAARGHDGALIGKGQWVAFRPEQIKSATGNNGDFDPANPDIRYRLSDTKAKGIPLFSARAIAKKVMAATGLNATVVNTEADLPADLQAQIKRDKATGRVAGVYHNGTAYLVAANLRDTKHAISVMLHEAIGHGGVKSVLGDRIGKVMAEIYRDMPAAMRKELERRYAKQIENLSDADANVLIAEEYVAHLAETDPQHSVINRLVALLRRFIRDTFGKSMDMKWTRNDIVQLLAEARVAARNNGRGPKGAGRYRKTSPADALAALPEVDAADESAFVASLKADAATRSFASAMYKARGTESPFFKAWFGKSRMVDKQGQPIAFVHRSYGERDTFTDADLGKNTGTPTAALGHFLARKDVGNVERYGPVVEQFYIRMEKPKVITQAQFEAMGDWSLAKVQAYRKTLMDQGHDGLYIQGLAWPVVFEGKNIKARRNQGTFDASERTRYNITEADFAAFDGAVDALARGKTFDKPIVIGRTPEVLKALGAADAPINISEDALWKAIDKHSLTPRDIKSAVKGIGSPVMVFDSATAPDGLVVLVEAFSRGRPVVVAVHLNRKENIIVNRIASMHAKDSPQFVRKWLDDGLLRYVDNKKADEWFSTIGLQLPKAEPKHRLGKKILRPADIDKFKTDERGDTRYSLNDDIRDLFNRATGPAPLDRNDPFAEENRRLRENEKTLWNKAKKVFARQFAPGGLLPESVFNEKITRDSEFQAVEFDVRHLSSALGKAVKADFGVEIDSLTAEQMKPLAEALAGKVDPNIPEATKVAIVAMRQYIDSLSGEYLGILQKQVEANMQGADQALIDKITGNLGAYVNRSYQAFDDPKWFKKVPTEVVNAARTYLARGYMAQGETAAEARRLADVTVNEILKNGTAYDSMGAFIAEGKLGAKDLTVLIKRKEIAPEIRALLGEYLDPRLNFAKSATKMGRLVWNQRFLDRVLEFGMGTLFFEGKNRPAEATTQIAGEQSETYAPLNGLWTTPEIAQAFKDALGKEQMSDLYRTVVRLNGMVKYGKTVLSPTTAMRNWQSAMFFSLANGHFDLTQMKKSWAAFREQVTQNATGDDLAYLRKLKRLGVVYDTPYAGEMMALLQDARMDELLSSKSGKGIKWLRKANQFAQGFYSFGDDFWKIIGFENEKASLIDAGIPEAEAEVMAAKRIRNTYPTYSMIGRAIQWLRRFPLAGTFVSFPSEIIRTTVNMFQLVSADLKSDNPKIRALGRKRALGMMMVSGGFYALAALSAAAAGVDDDEEEALRDLAAPWSKNSTFLYTGRDEDGKLRYFDMSFLDPYGYWKRPLTAMMRDQPWEQAAASGLSDMLSPFFGADITAGAIFEVLSNKKPTGGTVFNPDASSVDQLQDIASHMRKALQPGFMSNAERLWLAGTEARREGSGQPYVMRDELVSLLGWRASTLDTQTGLYYRSFDFTDGLANAKKTLTRTLRSSNDVSDDDIREAKESANAQYQRAFTEMGRLVRSAQSAGMSRAEVVQTLRLSGVAQRNIFALMNGRVPPIDIGIQAQTNAVRQAVVMRDMEHGAEIARRFALARQL